MDSFLTGDPGAFTDAVQPTVQHREAPSGCVVGRERGFRCLPVVPGSIYCANHDPDRKDRRRQITTRAAQQSHAQRVDPAVILWADTLDLTTDETRARGLTEVAQLVAKGGLTSQQGATIAALARAAAPQHGPKALKQTPQIIVETGAERERAAAGRCIPPFATSRRPSEAAARGIWSPRGAPRARRNRTC
jgi:hypothetical protein